MHARAVRTPFHVAGEWACDLGPTKQKGSNVRYSHCVARAGHNLHAVTRSMSWSDSHTTPRAWTRSSSALFW